MSHWNVARQQLGRRGGLCQLERNTDGGTTSDHPSKGGQCAPLVLELTQKSPPLIWIGGVVTGQRVWELLPRRHGGCGVLHRGAGGKACFELLLLFSVEHWPVEAVERAQLSFGFVGELVDSSFPRVRWVGVVRLDDGKALCENGGTAVALFGRAIAAAKCVHRKC